MKKEKTFGDCTLTFLEETFGLEELDTLPSLEKWLEGEAKLEEWEKIPLEKLRDLLKFNVHDWNEQELDMNFIGPLFSLVNFSSKKHNLFAQRKIEGTIDGWLLHGAPDNMIASGRRQPKVPYFAFQEYKKKNPDSYRDKGDPKAQALAAMLVGQSQNQENLPIYGCYVIGQDWEFMVLKGKKFAQSVDYSAITDSIFDIYRILKVLKQIVGERVKV